MTRPSRGSRAFARLPTKGWRITTARISASLACLHQGRGGLIERRGELHDDAVSAARIRSLPTMRSLGYTKVASVSRAH